MKISSLFFLLAAAAASVHAQQLQLHYDFRHSLSPEVNRRDFLSLSFEYFKGNDTAGAFLFKMQTDFTGERSNAGQLFLQVSKSIRFWKPKVYLSVGYSGGLGVAPPAYGYYLDNSFNAGLACPFRWGSAVLSVNLLYRYNAFPKPSHDPQFTFYFWKGFWNYRVQVAGSIVAWTQNRDLGSGWTKDLSGKKAAFFGDPQVWVKIGSNLFVGSRVNVFYHVLTERKILQVYPTLGLKNDF